MRAIPIIAAALILGAPARSSSAQQGDVDPVSVSPDKYKVLLENEQTRVVEYTIKPGERDQQHTHPAKVSYVASGGKLRITLADGTSFVSEDSTGQTTWMNPVPLHYAENIGTTPVRIILVEIKRVELPPAPRSQDPYANNPTSLEVKLENDSVRVMIATLPPGLKEKEHTHTPYVMYILGDGSVRMHLANGTTRDADLKAGMTLFSDPVTHWAENTGQTAVKALLVEIRRGRPK